MNTLQIKARAGHDGILKLEVPTEPNQDFDVVLILQPVPTEVLDEMGYPIGFFEETYGSLADDPIDETFPSLPDPMRDEIE